MTDAIAIERHIRQHGCQGALSAMLYTYGVADVIDTLALVVRDHSCVPGGAAISDDLGKLAASLPTCAWRNP